MTLPTLGFGCDTDPIPSRKYRQVFRADQVRKEIVSILWGVFALVKAKPALIQGDPVNRVGPPGAFSDKQFAPFEGRFAGDPVFSATLGWIFGKTDA